MPFDPKAPSIDTDSGEDDSIRVASTRPMDIESSDENDVSLSDLKKVDRSQVSNPQQATILSNKIKVSVPTKTSEQDVEMVDAEVTNLDDDEENVTEYSFKPEDDVDQKELDEESDLDDVRSHISVSDDEPEVPPIDEVPWRSMNRDQRATYERMFGEVAQRPIHGSWNCTELYQQNLDEKCMNYVKDFPISEWVLPRHVAESTVEKVLERVRWRAFGIKIFGPQPSSNRGPQPQPQLAPQHHTHYPMPNHQTLRSQPLAQPMAVPPGTHMGQPTRQAVPFAHQQQHHHHPNGNATMPMHRPPPYPMPGQMPYQAHRAIKTEPGASAKAPRKLKINVAGPRSQKPGDSSPAAPPPLVAPTPPYPARARPDPRKTVGKAGRGKTRRQAEADEFPWNRQLDFIQARIASKSKDTWDDSVYDPEMVAEMARTRVHNEPIVAELEKEISEKQKVSRKKKTLTKTEPEPEPEASSEDDGDNEGEGEGEDSGRRTKGGRKKSRTGGESGNDPYHSGNFAFAGPEDQQLASTMGMRSVDELIEAGLADKITLDELFRIKICWSPGKKGNSQELRQAKFSVKDTVITRKMLAKTPILTHRAGECIIDFCPDLLWRDILLRILSEAGFSNKDIRDRFCLNGSFSDRATVAKRLGAALGKDTNPPRGKGKEAAAEWCETNRDDFDNYQAFFGKRPPARRTAHGRKKAREGKAGAGEDGTSPSKATENDENKKKPSKLSLDGAGDGESAEESDELEQGQDDAVSLQDSDDLDAMSD